MKAIFYIYLFEQQCVIIEGLLRSEQLEKNTVAIGVDQSLSNSDLYEHIYLKTAISYTKPQLHVIINSNTSQ